MKAREHAATAALARLDKLAGEDWLIPEDLERTRIHYDQRLRRFAPSGKIDSECTLEAAEAFKRLRREMLNAERLAVIELRNQGMISDEVLHRIEQELDIEALRLDSGERRVRT
jgi:CPA1 family monovalent cation:H+ antiporter